MSMKKLFESQLRQQQLEIARQAVKQAFKSGISGKTTLEELFADLQDDDILWAAFKSLKFSELQEMIAPATTPGAPGATGGPVGPSRKRGVTSRRIVEFVRQNPGVRRNEIMKALGLKGGTVSSQLRTLRATGKLRGEGEERNLQYFYG